jgi:hypothetical protein
MPLGLKVAVAAFVCGWPVLCGPVAGQQFLVSGQSPSGPLLDDSESGSWLDEAPQPLTSLNGLPDSVVDESFGAAQPGASSGSPMPVPEAGLGYDGFVGAGGTFQDMIYCPGCGGSLTTGCPTCSLGSGSGHIPPGLHALGTIGPVAACMSLMKRPMTQESWLYRPLSAGWFMGFMQGSELIDDWVGQEQGFFGGYRLGWDTTPYWGWEMRFGFASVALYDSHRAKAELEAADIAAGIDPNSAYFHRFDTRRDGSIGLWDIDLLWYPYGDTHLRPYFLIGLGTARVDFVDRLSKHRGKSVFAMPIAIGFKYRLQDWCAVRVEATDNIIAGGSEFKTLHNFSLTAGLEVRFGGTRTAYWPYHPGRHYW